MIRILLNDQPRLAVQPGQNEFRGVPAIASGILLGDVHGKFHCGHELGEEHGEVFIGIEGAA
jgi:hypothetical protein